MKKRNANIIRAVVCAIFASSSPAAWAGGFGACCTPTGQCVELPQNVCTSLSLQGRFQGVGTTCENVVCTPFGPCCLPDLACLMLTTTECAAAGGEVSGSGLCESEIDPPVVCLARGACCRGDGGCEELLTFPECGAIGGVYLGFASTCPRSLLGTVCTGACSFAQTPCMNESTADACAAAGGSFLGGGTNCADFTRPTEAQCIDFCLPQNKSQELLVPRFDTQGGTRILQKARFEIEGQIYARLVLRNFAEHPVETTVEADQLLQLDFPPIGGGPFDVVDVLELIGAHPPILPPGESCDLGSPIVYAGSTMAMTTDPATPAERALLEGSGTFSATLSGTGFFSYGGTQFSLTVVPHDYDGRLKVYYEYLCVSCTPCPEDLNNSGEVDFLDLIAVLSVWGSCPSCPEDLDNSGDVGFFDLVAILSAWGPC